MRRSNVNAELRIHMPAVQQRATNLDHPLALEGDSIQEEEAGEAKLEEAPAEDEGADADGSKYYFRP